MNKLETFQKAVNEAARQIYLGADPKVDLSLIPVGESVHYNHCILTISEAGKIWDSVMDKYGIPLEIHSSSRLMFLINSAPSDVLGRNCPKSCYVCSIGLSEFIDDHIDLEGVN